MSEPMEVSAWENEDGTYDLYHTPRLQRIVAGISRGEALGMAARYRWNMRSVSLDEQTGIGPNIPLSPDPVQEKE